MAINNLELLADVVKHKSIFYKDNRADYKNATPLNIKIAPTVELNTSLEADYEEMAKSMIAGETPSYEELIEVLKTIQEKLRKQD